MKTSEQLRNDYQKLCLDSIVDLAHASNYHELSEAQRETQRRTSELLNEAIDALEQSQSLVDHYTKLFTSGALLIRGERNLLP